MRPAAACEVDSEGYLTIRLTNRGKDAAQATSTFVEFESSWRRSLPTEPIAPGATVEVKVRLPKECPLPCRVTVTADGLGEIPEDDEDNNRVTVLCTG